jgi:hypothetical protein
LHRDFSQRNGLDGGPDEGEATHLGSEDVDLVGALTNVAEQALNRVGGPDVAVHRLRKVVKGQGLVFLLGQAPHGLWVQLAISGW